MKLKRTFIWLFGAVALLAACGESSSSEEPAPGPDPGDGDGGNENTEYVAPEPPEEVNSSNLLQLRVLTTLSDQTLFGNVDPADVADWISPSTENVLMYLFERADFRLGEPLPQVEIGFATRSYSYFVQTEETSEHVQGTGIVTRHQASEIDAVWEGPLKISGCTVSAPLSQPATVTLYTTRFDTQEQIETLVAGRSSQLQTSGIVVGSIRESIKEEVAEWLKYNLRNYRIAFAGSKSSDYDLLVLTPVGYVCRTIDPGTLATLPCYSVSIEKL